LRPIITTKRVGGQRDRNGGRRNKERGNWYAYIHFNIIGDL